MFPRSFRNDQQEMNQNSLFKNSNIAEEMTFKWLRDSWTWSCGMEDM